MKTDLHGAAVDSGGARYSRWLAIRSLLRLLTGTAALIGLCLLLSAPQVLVEAARLCRMLLLA